jgi:hypothetical protein
MEVQRERERERDDITVRIEGVKELWCYRRQLKASNPT